MNTCYISSKCRFSQQFLEALSQTPYFREIKFVNVDTTPRNQLPSFLKSVPTLVVAGEPQPRTEISQLMNWISEKRIQENRQPIQNPGGPGAQRPGAGGGPAQGTFQDPMAMYEGETFGGFGGGGYAFIGEDNAKLDSGSMVRMVGNMAGINDQSMYFPEGRMGGGAASAGFQQQISPPQGNGRVSEKQAALDSRLAAMKAARESDPYVPSPIQRIGSQPMGGSPW